MEYEKIQGWFDFADAYLQMVQLAPADAVFVEVGAWYGKSTVCMAEYIKKSKKNIRFTTVDDWSGVDGASAFNYEVFEAFQKNIEPWKEFVSVAVTSSVVAANCVEDKSCDFVFLDGAHDYESVKKDITAWLPKIKAGGYIGGHDYTVKHPGVKRAVAELVPKAGRISNNSWLIKM